MANRDRDEMGMGWGWNEDSRRIENGDGDGDADRYRNRAEDRDGDRDCQVLLLRAGRRSAADPKRDEMTASDSHKRGWRSFPTGAEWCQQGPSVPFLLVPLALLPSPYHRERRAAGCALPPMVAPLCSQKVGHSTHVSAGELQ